MRETERRGVMLPDESINTFNRCLQAPKLSLPPITRAQTCDETLAPARTIVSDASCVNIQQSAEAFSYFVAKIGWLDDADPGKQKTNRSDGSETYLIAHLGTRVNVETQIVVGEFGRLLLQLPGEGDLPAEGRNH